LPQARGQSPLFAHAIPQQPTLLAAGNWQKPETSGQLLEAVCYGTGIAERT